MAEEKFIPNFRRKYLETVAPQLMKDFGFKSPMQIPKLEKITVSVLSWTCTYSKNFHHMHSLRIWKTSSLVSFRGPPERRKVLSATRRRVSSVRRTSALSFILSCESL